MSLSELANAPIEITLGGRKLKIQRLSISELFTPAETKIQQDYIKNIQEIAKGLEGKDKAEFLISSLNTVPKGNALGQMAIEYMSSPVGVSQLLMLGLNKCQTVTELEVADLMLNSSEQELEFLRQYLSGDAEDKKKVKAQEAPVIHVAPVQPTPF